MQRYQTPQDQNASHVTDIPTLWIPSGAPHSTARCTILVSLAEGQAAAGQRVCVVGSLPQLGSWDISNALLLEAVAPGLWTMEIDVTIGVAFEAKVSFARVALDSIIYKLAWCVAAKSCIASMQDFLMSSILLAMS